MYRYIILHNKRRIRTGEVESFLDEFAENDDVSGSTEGEGGVEFGEGWKLSSGRQSTSVLVERSLKTTIKTLKKGHAMDTGPFCNNMRAPE